MKPFILCLILAAGACEARAATYGDRFQQPALDAYVEKGDAQFGRAAWATDPAVKGRVLKLSGAVAFEKTPVSDRTKYQLAFQGRQEGVESIEENPRLGALVFNSRTFLPWAQVVFFDAAQKEVRSDQPAWALPFGQWHEYTWVFYPPANAVSMQLRINPGAKGNAVCLADLRLGPAPDEGAVNINPTFSLGLYNYSGWSAFNVQGGDGRLVRADDGRTVLFSGFSAQTSAFPLQEPGTYRIYFKATGSERSCNVILVFLDADGKEVGRINNNIYKPAGKAGPSAWQETTSHFVLPKGIVRGYFLIYHSVLQELRLVRIGGEEKYADVAKPAAP